jgi:chemotaxis methyl-accepting protein methylase
MESLRIHELDKYAQLVMNDTGERDTLDSLLRITITRFFRNSWLWTELGPLALDISGSLAQGEKLCIWSAGCAGGEEAFSAAMLLDDLGRSGHLQCPCSILATDTDAASLNRSREAAYQRGSVREVPSHLLQRWFTEEGGHWSLDQKVRDMVHFEQHDIITTQPPGHFHMVFLRNSILTYNMEEVQKKVLDRIRLCLLDPGYLIIGRTEKLPDGAGFDQVSPCIYRMT